MTQAVILFISEVDQDAIETRAALVGADILGRYRRFAMDLRQKGWEQVADLNAILEPDERAARRSASQLYCTAADELDDIIADLGDSLRPLGMSKPEALTLRVLDGDKAGRLVEDGPVQ